MDPWLQAAAIGLLAILIGLAFVFWGFRLFLDPAAHLGLLRGLPVRRLRDHGPVR